jgi:hypothetical protein
VGFSPAAADSGPSLAGDMHVLGILGFGPFWYAGAKRNKKGMVAGDRTQELRNDTRDMNHSGADCFLKKERNIPYISYYNERLKLQFTNKQRTDQPIYDQSDL